MIDSRINNALSLLQKAEEEIGEVMREVRDLALDTAKILTISEGSWGKSIGIETEKTLNEILESMKSRGYNCTKLMDIPVYICKNNGAQHLIIDFSNTNIGVRLALYVISRFKV